MILRLQSLPGASFCNLRLRPLQLLLLPPLLHLLPLRLLLTHA